jgi:hypothetical protein
MPTDKKPGLKSKMDLLIKENSQLKLLNLLDTKLLLEVFLKNLPDIINKHSWLSN